MDDLSEFDPERLDAAFRTAPTPAAALVRLELLLERVGRLRRRGQEQRGEMLQELRSGVLAAAARSVGALDVGLLLALLAAPEEELRVPGILARADLRGSVRQLREPVYSQLLDEVETADTEDRVRLWWVIESMARVVSMPPAVRERVFGFLHELPREIVAAFPEEGPPIRVIRRRRVREFPPAQQRAIEASAVVCSLVADRELPAEFLAALAPRALRFSDRLTRRQIAEHPGAGASVWLPFLQAADPADRALPGRVRAAWAEPHLSAALCELAADPSLTEAQQAAVRLHLCRGAPLDLADGWLREVLPREGLATLELLVFARPELAQTLRGHDLERLRSHPEVRAVLFPSPEPAGTVGSALAAGTLAELREGPGGDLIERLLAG